MRILTGQLLGNLLLFFGQFASLISQVPHRLVKLRRRLIAKLFLELIELPFSSGAFRNCLGHPPFIHSAGCSLHVAARFLHLLLHLLLRLFLGIRRLLHSFGKFVSIAQHFPLFIPQALQLTFNLFAFCVRFCRSKFTFQLLQTLVHHLLSLSQFFQAIQYLQLFFLLFRLLLVFLLLRWLLLRLIAIAFVIQFQLLQLLLRSRVLLSLLLLLLPLLLLLLLLSHLKFGSPHPQQRLGDFLFQWQSLCQLLAGRFGSGLCQRVRRRCHFAHGLISEGRYLRLLRSLIQRLLQNLNGLSLRLSHCFDILRQRARRLRQLTQQIPGCRDNLFLQLKRGVHLAALLTLLTLTGLLAL